ncbi:hypothetical protein SAMN05660748_3822 [Blastococcus aggregatus]|uniref:Uncharacterized protein n=1 Tax=Blastococcus aggregatus TaxID=38502 RepID=A0A285VF25_9ACTN|nr:hypothetical protein [Blastococcus aggregatus]SOC51716.1 hypothetical protein SAMN05660748_3822 [Blastococcus aggregatus]
MDRRLPALVALVAFAVLTWAAGAVVDADDEAGAGSLVLAFAGYAAVLLAAGLLLAQSAGARGRRTGVVLLITGLGMGGVHLGVALSDRPDADIGSGIVLLLLLVVTATAALRLLAGLLLDRRVRRVTSSSAG